MIKKDNILRAVQDDTHLSYEKVQSLYKITNSYDSILYVNEIAIKFGRDVVEIAKFLYRDFKLKDN